MHECPYADTINQLPYFIQNEDGKDVCGFCHVPKTKETATKAVSKTVRK